MSIAKQCWARALLAIDKIEESQSLYEVFKACQDYTQSIGGTSLLIGRIANPITEGRKITDYGLSDWPKEWAKKWVNEDYVIHDPITQYAMKSRATFDWDTARQYGTRFGKKILNQSQDFNLKKGVAIPVTVGSLPLGVVSISYEEEFSSMILSRLEIVSIHAYTRMLDFLNSDTLQFPLIELTRREIDILTFTAIGKTSWEIGKIYGIAEGTVKKHLQNIIKKTNAANKTHAVTKALKEGIIVP